MTYEQRSQFACEVCGNVPDEIGELEHGRGCYVISEDGGGSSFVPEVHQSFLLSRPWSYICAVDPAALARLGEWLDAAPLWPTVAPTKPQRIFEPPTAIVRPIMYQVLCEFDGVADVADSMMLSRMPAGEQHGMHFDHLHHNCLTRVHVPVVTNPGCWMEFEEERETFEAAIVRGDVTDLYNSLAPFPFKDSRDGKPAGEVVSVKFDGQFTVGIIQRFARVHFEAGKAYSFDARRRHAFGNDGDAARVHLIFDVLRK